MWHSDWPASATSWAGRMKQAHVIACGPMPFGTVGATGTLRAIAEKCAHQHDDGAHVFLHKFIKQRKYCFLMDLE